MPLDSALLPVVFQPSVVRVHPTLLRGLRDGNTDQEAADSDYKTCTTPLATTLCPVVFQPFAPVKERPQRTGGGLNKIKEGCLSEPGN